MSDPAQSKFARSWRLFTSSLQVIARNKKLLLFPVLSSACAVVIGLFFFAPALLYPSGHSLGELAHWKAVGQHLGSLHSTGVNTQGVRLSAFSYAYLAVLYLVSMFFATFFNVAFYNEILKALAGDQVSIRAGLHFACLRVRSILMWSLFAGLVGLIIKSLEERFGWVGRWVMRFVGVVWSVASVFAIPVLIREGSTNPITLLRNSASTLRKTWGESLIGYVGLTIGSWVVLLGSIGFLGVAVLLAVVMKAPLLMGLAFAVWLLAMLILGYAASVAGHVYRCALYVYASEGVVPAPYTAELMDAAWKVKKI